MGHAWRWRESREAEEPDIWCCGRHGRKEFLKKGSNQEKDWETALGSATRLPTTLARVVSAEWGGGSGPWSCRERSKENAPSSIPSRSLRTEKKEDHRKWNPRSKFRRFCILVDSPVCSSWKWGPRAHVWWRAQIRGLHWKLERWKHESFFKKPVNFLTIAL